MYIEIGYQIYFITVVLKTKVRLTIINSDEEKHESEKEVFIRKVQVKAYNISKKVDIKIDRNLIFLIVIRKN